MTSNSAGCVWLLGAQYSCHFHLNITTFKRRRPPETCGSGRVQSLLERVQASPVFTALVFKPQRDFTEGD